VIGLNAEIIDRECNDIRKKYVDFLLQNFSRWKEWALLSDRMEAGGSVDKRDVPVFFHTDYEWIKLLAESDMTGGFNWKDPAIEKLFAGSAESQYYRLWGDCITECALRLGKMVSAKSFLEVGAGNGKLTKIMTDKLVRGNVNIPLVLSDSNEAVLDYMNAMKNATPDIIRDVIIWDISGPPPEKLKRALEPPVVVYERASISYANYRSVINLAAAGDVFVFGDSFKYREESYGYDRLSAKIGLKPLMYHSFRALLEELAMGDMVFDIEATETLGYPDVTFIIAWK